MEICTLLLPSWDVKVCAISELWSGLKLMIRKSNRKSPEISREGGFPLRVYKSHFNGLRYGAEK